LRRLILSFGVFPEKEAKFFIAEMIVAVGCLHELGYIHRDLKPGLFLLIIVDLSDNFLISKEGHITLADFGII
jgi:serine/threonine protein kinase